MPLEYREQLAIKSSNRRRLPSLFSTSGKKQWKPAATLNGRPYVIGHVPVAPSPREVEFEGLLHGNNSTRILSLNPKRSATGLHSLPSQAPAAEHPPIAVMRIPTKTPEKRPSTYPRADETHTDFIASPAIRKSLFRPNRKSMLPAEYSTVEFETRMASYSDDEANASIDEPEHIKQKRRESSADAWVDILVGQDAETSEKKTDIRRSDPDLARQEVAQVLANRSPSPPSMTDRVDRDYGMDQHIDQHISDTDVVEVEHVPRVSRSTESEDMSHQTHESGANSSDADTAEGEQPPGTILNAHQMLRQQRRLGYFDLHPERRKNQADSIADDPRARLANDSDEEEDTEVYGPPDGPPDIVRPLPIPPITVAKPVIHEPIPVTPVKSIVQDLDQSPEMKISANAISSSTGSRTAALIEMYREREKGGTMPTKSSPNTSPIAPLVSSRLPVRTTSLSKDTPAPPPPPVIAVTIPPQPKVTPPPPNPSSPDPEADVSLDESDRSSPGRYVHGAPLHNVLEEEEEDD